MHRARRLVASVVRSGLVRSWVWLDWSVHARVLHWVVRRRRGPLDLVARESCEEEATDYGVV